MLWQRVVYNDERSAWERGSQNPLIPMRRVETRELKPAHPHAPNPAHPHAPKTAHPHAPKPTHPHAPNPLIPTRCVGMPKLRAAERIDAPPPVLRAAWRTKNHLAF
jgi:hypothetical protein